MKLLERTSITTPLGSASTRDRVYAVTFDLDTELLQKTYPGQAWNNAYCDMRAVLEEFGFSWQQGSVYFGDKNVTPVTCVLAIQKVKHRFDWFAARVRDVRMLRIEEQNDLRPALSC